MCASAAFLLLFSWSICRAFNVDTESPELFTGPKGSFFGYTVALNKNSRGPVVLVGAPKANSTTLKVKIFEPGALFECKFASSATEKSCRELALMKEGNVFRTRNRQSYSHKKDGMWLGVSLDVRQSTSQNDVVVCAHLWKNKLYRGDHLVNGMCYVIDADLDENNVKELLPLISQGQQLVYSHITGAREYQYAYAQAGMSAAFSEDASSLILGAPGFFSWTGSLVDYSTYRNRRMELYDEFTALTPPNEVEFYAYFGYSVTSGRFFESQSIQYAVGAPRDHAYHGKVYIVRGVGRSIYVQDKKRGFQLGEYFGASVLAIDINGDSFTELIVGAPLYSTELRENEGKGNFVGDEGKVYVYVSNRKDLQKQTEIEGDRKPGARFGTAIANIGDINQDGFLDIAVGAPYEDGRGAVYIYHGSKHGLSSRYAQKIEAFAINEGLSGFGIHISRGLDVDGNGYPDILVGSYISSQAVLFRSRPVIEVYASLDFEPRQIDMNTLCENSLTSLTCVQINTCLYYNGKHVPSKLDFKLSVRIRDNRRRAFFEEGTSHEYKSTMTLSVRNLIRECFGFRMFVKNGTKDAITPIEVLFSHELKTLSSHIIHSETSRIRDTSRISDEMSKMPKFDELLPIYSTTSAKDVRSQVPFQTGCYETDKCYSNLKVSSRRSDPPESMKFITLGTKSSVSVEIKVRNDGEPAYMSELRIYLPEDISATKLEDTCESGGQQQNVSLICGVGNPLRNQSLTEIHIKLDIMKVPAHTKYLEIVFDVVSISSETDISDNEGKIPLHFKTVYDTGVTGLSSVEQIMYGAIENSSAVITHTYVVKNHGPSPLKTINIFLYLPYEIATSGGSETIISGVHFKRRTSSSVSVLCDTSGLRMESMKTIEKKGTGSKEEPILNIEDGETDLVEYTEKLLKVKRSADEANPTSEAIHKKKVNTDTETYFKIPAIIINCENKDFRCVEIPCTASSFPNPSEYAEISVSFQVNFTVLDKHLGKWYRLEYTTKSSITVDENKVMERNIYPDVAQVKTDILHEGPPPPEKLESWIIYVSIAVGVLLLLIILILLIKIGFFKRKEKDKMRKIKSESMRVKKPDEVKIAEEEELEVEK